MKTDSATTRIPELDFEIPAFSQKGGKYKVRVAGLFMPGCSLAFLQTPWCRAWWLVYGFGHVVAAVFTGAASTESSAKTA